MSSTVTIRLNDEEKKIFTEHSKVYKGGIYDDQTVGFRKAAG